MKGQIYSDGLAKLRLATLLLLYIYLGIAAESNSAKPKQGGEMLTLLRAGETRPLSYGVYCDVNNVHEKSVNPMGSSLILILRNIGAKNISMDDVTVESFSLMDSHGRSLKLYLLTPPRTLAFGNSTVVHLNVRDYADAPQPWTLRFKSKPGAFVSYDLSIPGIELQKAVRK